MFNKTIYVMVIMSQKKEEKSEENKITQENRSGNESTSQYQIRPSIGKSFPISGIREIINEVLLQILDGNALHLLFYVTPSLIHFFFKGKEYSSKDVSSWCRQIVNDINRRIRDLEIPRYKHIVQIMLGEQTGAGCRYIARCHWDASCDSKVTEQYKSETIICIVTVFGVYQY